MKEIFSSIIFIIFNTTNISAQNDTVQFDTIFDGHTVSSDWIDQGIVFGVDFSKYLYGEIDYYRSSIKEFGGFPTLSATMNYGAEFSYIDKFVFAPKIQGRVHIYFFNASLTAICYSDLGENYSVNIRPEIGIGLWNIDINYGYNIGIYKNEFEQYNRNVVTIRYYHKLHRKHLNYYDRNGNKRL